MSEVCKNCQLPRATEAQWANNHGDGDGCQCDECSASCWSRGSFCSVLPLKRAIVPTVPVVDRYRTALERIAKGDVFTITQAVDIAWDALKDD